MKKERNLTAILLEKAARKSIGVAVNTRCIFCFHQPKQPEGIKKVINNFIK